MSGYEPPGIRGGGENANAWRHREIAEAFATLEVTDAIAMADTFARIAARWSTGLTAFERDLCEASAVAWSGASAEAMEAAVDAYLAGARALAIALAELPGLVTAAAEAIVATKHAVPELPVATGPADAEAHGRQAAALEEARVAMHERYVRPFRAIDHRIPLLPMPVHSLDLPYREWGTREPGAPTAELGSPRGVALASSGDAAVSGTSADGTARSVGLATDPPGLGPPAPSIDDSSPQDPARIARSVAGGSGTEADGATKPAEQVGQTATASVRSNADDHGRLPSGFIPAAHSATVPSTTDNPAPSPREGSAGAAGSSWKEPPGAGPRGVWSQVGDAARAGDRARPDDTARRNGSTPPGDSARQGDPAWPGDPAQQNRIGQPRVPGLVNDLARPGSSTRTGDPATVGDPMRPGDSVRPGDGRSVPGAAGPVIGAGAPPGAPVRMVDRLFHYAVPSGIGCAPEPDAERGIPDYLITQANTEALLDDRRPTVIGGVIGGEPP
ncbi:hypothetical protein [Nocardia rhizosphaerae]|uniref:PPE family protein n=1 Tax=Nocardia rhizosphaerae TaxID=1691571 RepID=A0ABV8L9T4_9NOCA